MLKLPRDTMRELDLLMEQLAKGEPEARREAMKRLVSYEESGKVTLESLREMTAESNPTMRMYAIQALGRNGTAKAAKALSELARAERNGNIIMLETIVDALGETGQAAAVPVLLELVGLGNSWKGRLSAVIKRKEEDPEAARLRERLALPVTRALEKLANRKVALAVEPFLDDADPLVRWHAIQTMLKSNCTDFNDKLKQLSQEDPHPLVKEAAEIALGELTPLPQHLNN